MSASPPPSYLDAAKAAPAEAPEPPKPKKKATFAANVLPPSLCPPGGSSDSSASPVPPGKAAAARMQSTRYSRSLLRQTRRSTALGNVSVSTLDDVKPIDNTNMKPVRVLVTMCVRERRERKRRQGCAKEGVAASAPSFLVLQVAVLRRGNAPPPSPLFLCSRRYDIKPSFSNTVKNGLGFWVL